MAERSVAVGHTDDRVRELEREISSLVPSGDESSLRPCLVLMGDHRFNLLAKDYESARLGVEFICSEAGIRTTGGLFIWGDEAIAEGWERP